MLWNYELALSNCHWLQPDKAWKQYVSEQVALWPCLCISWNTPLFLKPVLYFLSSGIDVLFYQKKCWISHENAFRTYLVHLVILYKLYLLFSQFFLLNSILIVPWLFFFFFINSRFHIHIHIFLHWLYLEAHILYLYVVPIFNMFHGSSNSLPHG